MDRRSKQVILKKKKLVQQQVTLPTRDGIKFYQQHRRETTNNMKVSFSSSLNMYAAVCVKYEKANILKST